jgi:ABC-type multidrug transport system fused ATPase/permease subunit
MYVNNFFWKIYNYLCIFFLSGQPVPISWPQKGNIVYENVSLQYENHPDNIISNLNLYIPTGQRVIEIR